MVTTPEQNRTVGKFGEPTTIDGNTFEIKGVETGTVYGQGSSLAEALALQTQGASAGTPTVSGRPDLYAVEPTQAEKDAGIQTITGAAGQQVTPSVATPAQLQGAAEGTLESFNRATGSITSLDEAVKEVINSSLEAEKDNLLNADENFDTQLLLQRGALYASLFEENLTPDHLRWLSPAQQDAIRSGDETVIKAQIAGLNTVINAREQKAAEAKAAAMTEIEIYSKLGVLHTLGDEEMERLATASGLSLEALKAYQPETEGRDTYTSPIYDEDGNQAGEQLRDRNTGEVLATYSTTTGSLSGSQSWDSWSSSIGNGNITQAYDVQSHSGISGMQAVDIDGEIGDIIYSPATGTVVEAVGDQNGSTTGWGNTIVIEDENGNKWRLAHFDSIGVEVGDTVSYGQQIGKLGNTGYVEAGAGNDGSHLHVQVRDSQGNYLNPAESIMSVEEPELAKDRFTDSQLAKGAARATEVLGREVTIKEFENLPVDEANRYVNDFVPPEEIIVSGKELIDGLLAEGDNVADIKILIDEAAEDSEWSDTILQELYNHLKEEGKKRDEGGWHFGDFKGPDPSFDL